MGMGCFACWPCLPLLFLPPLFPLSLPLSLARLKARGDTDTAYSSAPHHPSAERVAGQRGWEAVGWSGVVWGVVGWGSQLLGWELLIRLSSARLGSALERTPAQ